jgi:hypothetical protein
MVKKIDKRPLIGMNGISGVKSSNKKDDYCTKG